MISCEEFESAYIGDTARSLNTRFLEHCRLSSTTLDVLKHLYVDCQLHSIKLESAKDSQHKGLSIERGVKETI